jgi:hypothetical protein
MTKPPAAHPPWCLRTHACTAAPARRGWPARGEHRSDPYRLDTSHGAIIATLVASAATGRTWLETRLSLAIPEQHTRAPLCADLIAGSIAQAIRDVFAQADNATTTRPATAALRGHRQEITQ